MSCDHPRTEVPIRSGFTSSEGRGSVTHRNKSITREMRIVRQTLRTRHACNALVRRMCLLRRTEGARVQSGAGPRIVNGT